MHIAFQTEEGTISPDDKPLDIDDPPLKVTSISSRKAVKLDGIPEYKPPSKEFCAAVRRVQAFHDISHERDPHHINRIAATTTGTGLKPGDGRYAVHINCDQCNRTIDHVQRSVHTSLLSKALHVPHLVLRSARNGCWMVVTLLSEASGVVFDTF